LGIHVLGAGRRTELYRPLLRLLAQQDEAYIDGLLGDAVTETLGSTVISIFDGDPDPLIDVCADRSIEGAVRWNLMTALTRLAFDGAIPRERTLAFLDQFERESLAEPGDMAWIGWAEAIRLLGLEEMRERVHATWNDGRNPERKPDQRIWDEGLTLARSLAPGDPGLFVRNKVAALDDPVARLGWTAAGEATESKDAHGPPDPGAIFALTPIEMRWLKRFCHSRHVHGSVMYMEVIDGFFCGHIAGPGIAKSSDVISVIWRGKGRARDPDYDSPAQAEYVRALLARHWQTISMRLDAGYTHVPLLQDLPPIPEAAGWAAGFLRAVGGQIKAWTIGPGAAESENFVSAMMILAGRKGVVSG
jgi:yecA family protein